VTFLDSDDLLLPRSLSSRLAGFERTDADCVFCRNLTVVYPHGCSQKRLPFCQNDLHSIPQVWPAKLLIDQFIEQKFFVFAQAFLIPRPTLQSIGGFDESLQVSVDVEFFSRLLPVCRTLVETFVPYYIYRRLPGSLSAINSRQKATAQLRALRQAQRNLAPYLCGREEWVAQSLFDFCVKAYPYWTHEHRLAMAEARRLRGEASFDLAALAVREHRRSHGYWVGAPDGWPPLAALYCANR
jgi:hypothetical protein